MTSNSSSAPLIDSVVPLAQTQQKMDLRSRAAMKISPHDEYTLADRLEHMASLHANRPFITYTGQTIQYAEINQRAAQMAAGLHQLGIQPGDTVAMAIENRPEFFITWFAIAKLGAITAFLNTHVQGNALHHAIVSTQAKAVIVGAECQAQFVATETLPDIPYWYLPETQPEDSPQREERLSDALFEAVSTATADLDFQALRKGIKASDPMLLIFTSGTTGLPKAAIYSHLRWLCSGDVMEVTIQAKPEDVFYCCLPLYHGAAATSVTSTALAAGASIVLRRKFSVSQFWREVIEHKVTVLQYIGEICRYLLTQPAQVRGQHHLRAMMGAGLTPKIWQQWLDSFGPLDVYEGWGSTEANTNLINLDNYIGACGRVPDWQRTNFRLLKFDVERNTHVRDENGFCVLCEPGEIGEAVGFIVQDPDIGVGKFEGYSNPAENEKKILRDVFVKGDAYWSSGDLLRYDNERYFYFVDRIGDTFRWKSENVSTQEVAAILAPFPGVELVNVYGVLVPENEGRAGMANIVMQPGHLFDGNAFYDFVETHLLHYARPLFVRLSSQADMTSTFKLRKVDLQKQGYCPKLCQEPLFIKSDNHAQYVPFDEDLLAQLGYRPFQPVE